MIFTPQRILFGW